MTAAACRGFVYATAVMGVTGARATTSDLAGPLVARTGAVSPDLPVGVGLGVSNGDQAAEVASYADGVIVGSAFVRALLDHPDDRAAGPAGAHRAHRGPGRGVSRRGVGRRPLAGASCSTVALAGARSSAARAAVTASTARTTTAARQPARPPFTPCPRTPLVDTDGEPSRWPTTPTSGSRWSSSATPTAPTSAST